MKVAGRLTRSRRTLTVGAAVLGLVTSGAMIAAAVTPPPAHLNNTVGLKQVGPIDETNGFPLWYKDTNNVRLQLCLDPADPYCIMGAVPDPTQPVSFPGNFPDEAFWSVAESAIDPGAAGKALLVTAVEAAFASADGLPAKGQQISFGRVRLTILGIPDGDYKITHPYGVDNQTAEGGSIKTTEDIGSLTPDGVFDQTLGSRPGPFLKWNADAPAAPPGYLGDPTVDHRVTGSPYGTNFFRIEGPVGAFTGSTQLCADATLGASPTATSDCIESSDFAVQGKIATRLGVQATKAFYTASGAGNMMDLFATSEPGQNIVVRGTGIPQTKMRGDASGHYYARVFGDGPPPADLSVTNLTDSPDTVDHIDQAMFGDRVHITGAAYDNGTRELTVQGQSGDPTATLTLQGHAAVTPTDLNGVKTWTVPDVLVPPDQVVVTSSKGGVDSEDVVITGPEDPAAPVQAVISADSNALQVGQTLSLDGLQSTGSISSYAWSVSGTGATLSSLTGAGTTFRATGPGSYTVSLKVTGSTATNTSTDSWPITVSDVNAAPAANAGPDQLGVAPTSTVTLDGTASKFASTYSWTQTAGPAVTLSRATSANPTFVVPVATSNQTFTFKLTITDVNGTAASDTVDVTSDVDDVTVDSAFYKRGSLEWRVRGTAQYCSANNLLSVYWNKPGVAPVLLGTVTPSLALGICDYDFRLKNTPTGLRPGAAGTITVRSALGGVAADQAFSFL